jgi:tripartite ATP-independent transporter DctP family solute receptor
MQRGTSSFLLGLLIGILAAAGGFAWLGQNKGAADTGVKVLKVAHGLPENHPVHHALMEMARIVEVKSGGRMKLSLFPNEQLGSQVQCLEQAQVGTLAITKVSTAPVGTFVPVYRVFSLPYLFRDEDHFWRVLDGEIGQDLLKRIEKRGDGSPSGLHGLAYFDSGSRSFYTQREIHTLADLKGLKLRTMSDPVAMDMVSALGASPTPIAFGELYSALQSGAVDGAENNPPSMLSSRHHEVCKYYLLNHHSRIPDVLVMSRSIWETLTTDEQRWITEAATEAGAFQRKAWKEETKKALDALRQAGVKITEADTAAFAAATEPVRKKHATGDIGALAERILKAE